MAHDVFISYAHDDKPVADAACAVLESKGIRCWIAPRDAVSGIEWGGQIVRAITEADVLVLVYSRRANESQQVKREVERAVAKGLAVIPFRIENVPASETLEYFISTPHWLDALTPPMERHLEALAQTVRTVQEHMGTKDRDEAPPPPPPPFKKEPPPAPPPRPPGRSKLGLWGGVAGAIVVLAGGAWAYTHRDVSWDGHWTTTAPIGPLTAAFTMDVDGKSYRAAVETRDTGRIGFRGVQYRMVNAQGQPVDGTWEMLGEHSASVAGPLGTAVWTRDPRSTRDPRLPWGTWTAHVTLQNLPWTLRLTAAPNGTYELVSRYEDSGSFTAGGGRWAFGSARGVPQSGTYSRVDGEHVSMTGPLGTAIWERR